MKSRIQRIFSNSDEKVDAFIIVNSEIPNLDSNFFYTSNIITGVFEHCYVIAHKNGRDYLITSEMEESIARKETKLKVLVSNTGEKRKEQLKKLLSGIKRLGINGKNISYKDYKTISKLTKAKIVDISNAFTKTRSIKDENEIKAISKACKISSKVANEFPNYIKSGVTENGLSRKLIELQYKHGAKPAFPPIVAFGKNSSSPHHSPTDKKLKKNEFVLIDFGAEFDRYASDISRTFVFGRANRKMKEMYETVLDAQLQAIDAIKDGVNGKDIDKLTREIIDKKFKGRFLHSLGHEVGLSIHDGTALGQQDFTLKKNMTLTVEPGVYIPSIGGVRIEDTVLVRKGRAKVLTNSPKELLEI